MSPTSDAPPDESPGAQPPRSGSRNSSASRLARRLYGVASPASLLLLMSVCVLWVRSYRLSDQVNWRNAGGYRSVRSASGHLVVSLFLTDWSGRDAEFHGPQYERDIALIPFNYLLFLSPEPGDRDFNWRRAGFAWYGKRNPRRGITSIMAFAPFWSLAAITAALPMIWTAGRWRSRVRALRQKRRGLCPECGYDLRATPQRCPECGSGALRGIALP